jgi:fermentation-respiration switch protein FrsA (DUF1100 family)
MLLIAAGILAALMADAAAAQAPTFDYQPPKQLTVKYGEANEIEPGVKSRSVQFPSPTHHTVIGELITGDGGSSHPGILFVHWLGNPKTTNHTQFEPDAIALAKRGVTSLLVDTMWAGGEDWFNKMGKSVDNDYRDTVDQIVDLRVALDVLMAQPGIDASRVAFVAHDFGAMFGSYIAGIDPRPQYYVLIAGNSSLPEWYLFHKQVPNRDEYMARFASLDMLSYLGKSKAKGFLFQFSKHDFFIPTENQQKFFTSAPEPKKVIYYDAKHDLGLAEVFADRQAWLEEKLFAK